MPALSGHTDRVWDKSYMYCGNSHSLFILKGQHSLPAYHCCSCCRACYGIRLTGNDFLPKSSGTERRRLHPGRGNHSSRARDPLGWELGMEGLRRRRQDPQMQVTWQHVFHPKLKNLGNLLSPSQPTIPISDAKDHCNFHGVHPSAQEKRGAWGCW